jgi:homoserine dehydrogenase
MVSPDMNEVKLGICGLGTVGGGAFNVLLRNADVIAERCGCPVRVVHVGARRDMPNCDTSGVRVSRDVFEVARDPDVDIVLELIGGTDTALELVREAIAHGKHVVTANKALIAEHGNELLAQAEAAGVIVAFEAAVAGGIPIIKALREGLAGNRIEWLAGIINGTGNFILTEMRDKGRDFSDVLEQAQQLGYAEADPTFDVEGIDAAHKLVILAAIAFGMPLEFDKVYTEGISRIAPEDVDYAEELGYRIKHLGIARRTESGIELRVHPTLIPETRLLANVNGVMNAILVEADAVGPTLYYGAGAGAEPTASAVLADVVDLARNLAGAQKPTMAMLGRPVATISPRSIVPMEEVETACYLRMLAEDRPGVLSEVARIFSDAGISIEALIQKPPGEGQERVPVIILTNKTTEGKLMAATEQLERLPTIAGAITRIRVESLDG